MRFGHVVNSVDGDRRCRPCQSVAAADTGVRRTATWTDVRTQLAPTAWVRCTIGRMPIYLDHAATTPLRREVLDAMLPLPDRVVRQPELGPCLRARRARGARRRPRTRREAPQRRGSGDRLHVRRDRGEQPRAQGRRLGRQGARPPDRDLVGRAPRGRSHAALPREVRLRDRRAAGRPLRPGRSRPARGGPQRQDDPGLDHARQQRGRHDPADRGDRRPGPDSQGRPLPRRCGPGGAVRRPRRRGAGRRPRLARRPQVRGTQGRRRAVRPPRDAHPRPAAGRHPGTPSPGRHGERGRRRRPGDRVSSSSCAERPETVARLRDQRDRLARRGPARRPASS